jgi:hypothetical protein
MKNVNWLGLVVSLIVGQVIGFLWYGTLFAQAWMKATGVTEGNAAGQEWKMGLGMLNMLVVLLGLDWLIRRVGVTGFVGGARIALIACGVFALTVVSLNYLYASGAVSLLWIDGGYQLVTYLVFGALLGGLKMKPKAA